MVPKGLGLDNFGEVLVGLRFQKNLTEPPMRTCKHQAPTISKVKDSVLTSIVFSTCEPESLLKSYFHAL